MNKDVFIIGTGESILHYKEQLKLLKDKTTFTWGRTFMFFVKHLGYYPTYWSFLDPDSAMEVLGYILEHKDEIDTTILLPYPIVTKNYETQVKFIGTTSVDYDKYLTLLARVQSVYKNIQLVPMTSLKNIALYPEKNIGLVNKDLDDIDASLRFSHNKVVIGMKDKLHIDPNNPDVQHMNGYENKLTMCMLPIAHSLGFNRVFICGFDGKGGRWHNSAFKAGVLDSAITYKAFLTKWKHWEKYTNMKIISIASSEHTVVNDYIDYIPIEKVISENSIWVLGTGESLHHYCEDIKTLKYRTTLGFHKFFPHCVKHFGFYPTYWFWSDANAALEGIEYLTDEWHRTGKTFRDMTIVVPEYCLASFETLKNYASPGAPMCLFNEEQYNSEYLDKLKLLIEKKIINSIVVPSTTSKRMGNYVKGLDDKQRFGKKKLFFGSGPSTTPMENKLTFSVLPVAHFLGFKDIYIAGFDCKGGRFFNLNDKVVHGYNLKYLHKWNTCWKDITGVSLYSVVSNEYTELNKTISYLPFDKAYINDNSRSYTDTNNIVSTRESFWKEQTICSSDYIDKYEETRQWLAKEIVGLKPKRVLEIGCGHGLALKAINELDSNIKLFGLDINQGAINLGREILPRTNFMITSAYDLGKYFFKDYFDVIFSIDTMSCIPTSKLRNLFENIYRICSGEIIQIEPNGKIENIIEYEYDMPNKWIHNFSKFWEGYSHVISNNIECIRNQTNSLIRVKK